MQNRSEIWLGDALQVRHALGLDADATREMLRLLGFQPGDTPRHDRETAAEEQRAEPEPKLPNRHVGGATTGEEPPKGTSPDEKSQLTFSVLERLETHAGSRSPPQWFADQRAMAPAFAPPTRPPRPLFSRLHRRSIVSYAIGRDVPEGALDIAAIARTLTQGQMPRTLPRRPRRTLRYGVEVLVDRARWMEPFFRDQDGLVDYLETLLPADRLHVRQISGRPLDSARRAAERLRSHHLHPYAPVLALSDLGVGYRLDVQAPPSPREWLRYAHEQRRAGRSFVVFMPYPRSRWPGSLRRSIALMHWSERTTAGHARRLRGGGRPDHPPRDRGREEAHVGDLARVLSTAVRVDPWLLREARRLLVPQSDVATEADLWFSGFVSSRGPAGLMFKPQLAEALRSELVEMPDDAIVRAIDLVNRAHSEYPEAIRIEEHLRTLSIAPGPDAQLFDELLRPALKALHKPQDASGAAGPLEVARWTVHAWDRLPAAVRQTNTARQLALAAALHLNDGAWVQQEGAGQLPEDAAWLLPESTSQSDVGYGVELRQYPDGDVELAVTVPYPLTTARHMIRVPHTEPALLEVRREHGEETIVQTLALSPGATLPLSTASPEGRCEVVLRTLRGDEYRLRTATAREVAERCLVRITGEQRVADPFSLEDRQIDEPVSMAEGEPAERSMTGVYVGDGLVITGDMFEDRSVVVVHLPDTRTLRGIVHSAIDSTSTGVPNEALRASWAYIRLTDPSPAEGRGSDMVPADVAAVRAAGHATVEHPKRPLSPSAYWRTANGLIEATPRETSALLEFQQFEQPAGGLAFRGYAAARAGIILTPLQERGERVQRSSMLTTSEAAAQGAARRAARLRAHYTRAVVPLHELREKAFDQQRRTWRLMIWSADDQTHLRQKIASLLMPQVGPERVLQDEPAFYNAEAIRPGEAWQDALNQRLEKSLLRADVLLLIGDPGAAAFQIGQAVSLGMPVLWLPLGDPERALAALPEHLRTYLPSRQWLRLSDGGDANPLSELAARLAHFDPFGGAAAPAEESGPRERANAAPVADRPAGSSLRSRLLRMVDNVDHATNLYHCPLLQPFELKAFATPTGDAPILLMIHGDGASGRGSFGPLWDSSNEIYRRQLYERYSDRTLSFEYHSVTRGLLQNAVDLAQRLPARATLDLLTIGGGGVIGELLCRAGREDADSPFDEQDFGILRNAGLGETRESARKLDALLRAKQLRIRQFVRVACPIRGAVIWEEGSAQAFWWLKAIGIIPVPLVSALNVGAERLLVGMLNDESIAPGLTQLLAASAILRLIHRPGLRFAGELAIVAGTHDGTRGLKARLQALIVRSFLKEDSDFVVSLDSNFGGAERSGGVYRFVDSGPDVTHFNYFRNESSLSRIVTALIEGSERAGFERAELQSSLRRRSSLGPLGMR